MFSEIHILSQLIVGIRAVPTLLNNNAPVSAQVFEELEELARIVDISYCVGSSGIRSPFNCYKCNEFEGFELVSTWNTGPLLSDSCGYIAISHAPFKNRVIVAFRGTYSIANTVADLSYNHVEYVKFKLNDSNVSCEPGSWKAGRMHILPQLNRQHTKRGTEIEDCKNCTIHTGFFTSWQNTRCRILPDIEKALQKYPDYELVLVGHSLGGAVAAIAALELQARGYQPQVTTFGQPRLGNVELNNFIDRTFNLNAKSADDALFRRVTHVDDPVPLLPLREWGYSMHAGEIFISKSSLPPTQADLQHCRGDADPKCIAGSESNSESGTAGATRWGVPSRYKLWQLFFSHRDYFVRLGLCLPGGGDPWDWNRGRTEVGNENEL